MIERGGDDARTIGRLTYRSGGSYTVGLTGAPGAGKSTLTSTTIKRCARGLEVAVLAIDPSSPFSGGAILGDRVRMQDHATDPGVFIRSYGDARSSRRAGAGDTGSDPAARCRRPAVGARGDGRGRSGGSRDRRQGRYDGRRGESRWGDSVQANKAGLMEIADIFVINKADRPGVDQTHCDSSRCSTCPISATTPGARRSSPRSGRPGWRRPALEGRGGPPRGHLRQR